MANPKYATTVADSTTVRTITTDKPIRKFWVENINGAGPVWFTVDGTTPAVGADGSFTLTSPGALEFELEIAAAPTVKFVSANAVLVAVRTL